MIKILIVDDKPEVCISCQKILAQYTTRVAHSGEAALLLMNEEGFEIVLTDLKMSGISGIELLRLIKKKYPQVIVVVITGYATVETAVEAMKEGAFDYIPKPFTPDEVRLVVKNALEKLGLWIHPYPEKCQFDDIIGFSPAMQEIFNLIRKVAPTSGTVFIYGESGTGKELLARAIHNNSQRKDNRFVAVDCATFPAGLLESALFGHIKGAFTGAVANKTGFFEMAHGGTLFIDEIGNISLEVQGKLLRALQEREFTPVGGTDLKKVNVRIISATNKDLPALVAQGSFREDLFYRLYVLPITLPPLKERKPDIPLLVNHFLKKQSIQLEKTVKEISPPVMQHLINYDWPGNIRQLENVIERMVITSDSETIMTEDLPLTIQGEANHCQPQSIPTSCDELKRLKKQLFEQATSEIERQFLIEALKRNHWNVTQAAKEVGMQRPNFHALMRKHQIGSSG